MLSDELSVYEYSVFAWTKGRQKKRTSLFDNNFRVVNATSVGLCKTEREMRKRIEYVIERDLTFASEQFGLSGYANSAICNGISINDKFELSVVH